VRLHQAYDTIDISVLTLCLLTQTSQKPPQTHWAFSACMAVLSKRAWTTHGSGWCARVPWFMFNVYLHTTLQHTEAAGVLGLQAAFWCGAFAPAAVLCMQCRAPKYTSCFLALQMDRRRRSTRSQHTSSSESEFYAKTMFVVAVGCLPKELGACPSFHVKKSPGMLL
jgi:hypothetical protein